MASVPLKRVGGLARVAAILVGASGVLSLVSVAATRLAVDEAEAYLDGDIGETEFLEAATSYALLSFVQALSVLAAAVVVIVWMHRVARNLRALHRGTTWGPGWAIGGWFAPPLLFVIPYLALREMWKASDPEVPVGGEWRSRPVAPVVTAWFVVFGPIGAALQLAQLGDTFAGLGGGQEALAEQITGSMTIPVIAAIADIVAAALFILLVRGLTARHRQLTGEARA
jgi:hypothetical protein